MAETRRETGAALTATDRRRKAKITNLRNFIQRKNITSVHTHTVTDTHMCTHTVRKTHTE